MIYYQKTQTKDQKELILRNAERRDAAAFVDYFVRAHGETEFLTTYPEEYRRDAAAVAEQMEQTKASEKCAEICAFVDGKLVGSAGISMVRDRIKTRHRAEFGISILKAYWGQGIGTELTRVCVELAKRAGYLQLELDVVAENERAIALYQRFGFTEYGRNPKAFRTREGRWQELVLMRLELN